MSEALLSFWSHALAAVLFGSLAIWQLSSGPRVTSQRMLLGALAFTCLWAWLEAIRPNAIVTDFAETGRNLMWLALLHSLALSPERETRQKGVRLVYGAVAAVLGLQVIVDLLPALTGAPHASLAMTSALLRITAAAGGLVLIHNIYGQAAPASRPTIRYAMIALAALWAYDLNYYTLAYLDTGIARPLAVWRGFATALTAPFFAMGARREEAWRIRLSRAATFQSISLVGICAYLAVMAILANILRDPGNADWIGKLAVIVLSGLTLVAMAILPSQRARGWAKVKIAKHFFEHRYDYRGEWLRFTATLGAAGPTPLGQRVIKGFADMLDSPGGLLLVADDHGHLVCSSSIGWDGTPLPPTEYDRTSGRDFWQAIAVEGRILELDGLRGGWGEAGDLALPVPAWLLENDEAWVGVPLPHNGALVGLVILAAPDYRRALDWEDFDLMKTAGRQAASSLAEAQGQEALAKAQRFEEFNRRFAFILHDIKNLVSQLSLLSRNAERHADNAEFRADMVATLKSSVGKMNDLLARLSPQAQQREGRAAPTLLKDVLGYAIAAKRRHHDVQMIGNADIWALADADGLEQAVGHLLQNAIDASDKDAAVTVRIDHDDHDVCVSIVDQGAGMDADFIRARLFEPFASTKDGGFGIGAFEARSLIIAMGGRLTVESKPGEGTKFTIHLPAAKPAADQRKIA